MPAEQREEVIINQYSGPVIQINGKCYSFKGTTVESPTHGSPDYGQFQSCVVCQEFSTGSSSSSSGSSESSDSV